MLLPPVCELSKLSPKYFPKYFLNTGVALWARVSDEVDEKLSANLDRPARLRPDEWTSGENLWLIDAVGAPAAVKAMVERLSEAVFEGRPYKLRARGQDGKVSVQTVGRKAA